VTEYTSALAGLSEATLDQLVRQEQMENAQTLREHRERTAAVEARRQDLAQMVKLGLKQVRSPNEILAGYAGAGDGVDQNAQRCRAVFEQWLQAGGEAAELKELLGHRAAQFHATVEARQASLRSRVLETEARKTQLEKRVEQLERENAWLRSQQDRTFEVLAEHEQGRSVRSARIHADAPPGGGAGGRCYFTADDGRQCVQRDGHVGSHQVEAD